MTRTRTLAARRLVAFPLVAAFITQAFAADPGASPSDAVPRVFSQPAQVALGFERVRLPDREVMGLLNASYLLELAPGSWVGPALYGAATGQRGGLFTWGVEAQQRWRIDERWAVTAGLYVGGGGGASAPVGGGLMLRPHVDLLRDFGPWAAGLSASNVRFPSGAIHSTQLGLLITLPHEFTFTAPGADVRGARFDGPGGLGMDRMDVVLGRYVTAFSSGGTLGYVGMRLQRRLDPVLTATFEAAGAASGNADGYAEGLVGLLALWPLSTDALRLGVRGAIGLGGGGAVATAGGPIAKLGVAGRAQLIPQLSLEFEAGRARALSGNFNSAYAQLAVGVAFGDATPRQDAAGRSVPVHDMEWAFGVQDVLRTQRKDGRVQPMSVLGLKFARSIDERWYLSGQALNAIGGGAGAYSAGLIGVGARTGIGAATRWSVGAEALVGAGGGGGVASQGGALVQPMLWAGRDLGTYSWVRFGTGFVKSVRGDLASPVVDVTWGFRFGVP